MSSFSSRRTKKLELSLGIRCYTPFQRNKKLRKKKKLTLDNIDEHRAEKNDINLLKKHSSFIAD